MWRQLTSLDNLGTGFHLHWHLHTTFHQSHMHHSSHYSVDCPCHLSGFGCWINPSTAAPRLDGQHHRSNHKVHATSHFQFTKPLVYQPRRSCHIAHASREQHVICVLKNQVAAAHQLGRSLRVLGSAMVGTGSTNNGCLVRSDAAAFAAGHLAFLQAPALSERAVNAFNSLSTCIKRITSGSRHDRSNGDGCEKGEPAGEPGHHC
jgi:hypothetical protein